MGKMGVELLWWPVREGGGIAPLTLILSCYQLSGVSWVSMSPP